MRSLCLWVSLNQMTLYGTMMGEDEPTNERRILVTMASVGVFFERESEKQSPSCVLEGKVEEKKPKNNKRKKKRYFSLDM